MNELKGIENNEEIKKEFKDFEKNLKETIQEMNFYQSHFKIEYTQETENFEETINEYNNSKERINELQKSNQKCIDLIKRTLTSPRRRCLVLDKKWTISVFFTIFCVTTSFI